LVTDITAINISDLEANKAISSGDTITKDALVDLGVISQAHHKVKILGNGDISKSLTFDGVEYFSSSAKVKIEKAGGTVNQANPEESAA
jgi:large subunit ribosomal protein L15